MDCSASRTVCHWPARACPDRGGRSGVGGWPTHSPTRPPTPEVRSECRAASPVQGFPAALTSQAGGDQVGGRQQPLTAPVCPGPPTPTAQSPAAPRRSRVCTTPFGPRVTHWVIIVHTRSLSWILLDHGGHPWGCVACHLWYYTFLWRSLAPRPFTVCF